jgi:phage repressor protein C with HTH and peptisase S24 domain
MKAANKAGKLKLKQESGVSTLVSTSHLEVETFGDRLYKIIGSESARTFALKAKLTPAAFHKYLKGQSEPTRPVMNIIAETAGVNLEWLSTGRGPMMKSDTNTMAAPVATGFTVSNFHGEQLNLKLDPNLIHIPVLSLEAACGLGAFSNDNYITAMFSATREWLALNLRQNPDNLCLIHAIGDSMTDTIKPNDMVFVDPEATKQPSDGIWVYSNEEQIFLKRLQFMPKQKVKIISDNPAYETYTIDITDSFHLLARHIAVLNIKL